MRLKVKLVIGERYVLMGMLPSKGTFSTLLILKALQEKLALNEEEKILVGWAEDAQSGVAKWDSSKDEKKDILFTEGEAGIIKEQLKALDAAGDLHFGLLKIYDNFVNEKGVEALPNE